MKFNVGDKVKYTGRCVKGRNRETATVIGYSTNYNSNTSICIIRFADKDTWECHESRLNIVKEKEMKYRKGDKVVYTGYGEITHNNEVAVIIYCDEINDEYVIQFNLKDTHTCSDEWLDPVKPEYVTVDITVDIKDYPEWMWGLPRGRAMLCYVSDIAPVTNKCSQIYIIEFAVNRYRQMNGMGWRYAMPVTTESKRLENELSEAEAVVLSIKQQIKEVRI